MKFTSSLITLGCLMYSMASTQGLDIDLVFTQSVSDSTRDAFYAAATKWTKVITTTLSTVPAQNPPQTVCSSYTINTDLPGIRIFVTVKDIDGQGGILGYAGPCAFGCQSSGDSVYNALSGGRYCGRTGTGQLGAHPIPVVRVGTITLDAADLDVLSQSQRVSTIAHEMGHIIGIGTVWENAYSGIDLVTGAYDNYGDSDPRYTGSNGVDGYHQDGGADTYIPVENTGGAGTARGHWRQSVFGDELMTGFLSGSEQPIGLMTIKSLEDLGFAVDTSQAGVIDPDATGTPGAYDGDTVESGDDTVDSDGNVSTIGLSLQTIIIISASAGAGIIAFIAIIIYCRRRRSSPSSSKRGGRATVVQRYGGSGLPSHYSEAQCGSASQSAFAVENPFVTAQVVAAGAPPPKAPVRKNTPTSSMRQVPSAPARPSDSNVPVAHTVYSHPSVSHPVATVARPPQVPARPSSSSSGGLPSGWEQHVTTSGQTYYYNRALRRAQWEAPTAAASSASGNNDSRVVGV